MLVHLCVCLYVCRMDVSERYIWDFDLFLILLLLILTGGTSMILGVYWGIGATYLVRCHLYWTYLGLAMKYIYFDCDLINYYFDHLIM